MEVAGRFESKDGLGEKSRCGKRFQPSSALIRLQEQISQDPLLPAICGIREHCVVKRTMAHGGTEPVVQLMRPVAAVAATLSVAVLESRSCACYSGYRSAIGRGAKTDDDQATIGGRTILL